MKTANEVVASHGTPEGWQPLMELACKEVFEIMLACKLDPFDGQDPGKPEFTAMVGLAGKVRGVLTLRCMSPSAALMASKMLGVDLAQADEHMFDALGEVCNMIAGNFKNKLTGVGDGCMLSVPTVITGADYSFHSLADAGILEVKFMFESLPIAVSLEVQT